MIKRTNFYGSYVMTEFEKMAEGQLFDGNAPSIQNEYLKACKLLPRYNATLDHVERQQILVDLLGNIGAESVVRSPFTCEFGRNISIGSHSFINFNVTMLDGAKITIGNNVLIGPACQLYTPTHSLDYQDRRNWNTYCYPITIEDDVWLGGNVVVAPGVTIGARSVIAANSFVNHDILPDCVYGGSPAKLIRKLN